MIDPDVSGVPHEVLKRKEGTIWKICDRAYFTERIRRVYPRHLNSSLTDHQLKWFAHDARDAKRNYPLIPHEAFRSVKNGFCGEYAIFPFLENYLEKIFEAKGFQHKANLDFSLSVAHESLMIQTEIIASFEREEEQVRLSGMVNRIKNDYEVIQRGVCKALVCTFHDDLTALSSTVGDVYALDRFPGITIHRDLVLIHEYDGTPLAITFDMLLNVLGKIEQKFEFALYLSVLEHSHLMRNQGLAMTQWSLYKTLDGCAVVQGSSAASLCKMLEPLAVGVLLATTPEEERRTEDTDFLDRLLRSLDEEKPDLFPWAQEVVRIFKSIVTPRTSETIAELMDSYGQEKLHFYPIVDDEGGMVKMYRYGTSWRPYKSDEPYLIAGEFVKRIVRGHFEKYECLPPIFAHEGLHLDLLRIWGEGVLPSEAICDSIPLEEWEKIDFRCFLDFNYFEDEVDLIEDKACSPGFSKKNQSYAAATLRSMNLPLVPRDSQDPTKLVEFIFQQESISSKALFEECVSAGTIPEEWCLIKLLSKERELKCQPRMFSVLHPKSRILASTLEKNISSEVFKFFPQQTMTSEGPALVKTVDSFASGFKDDKGIWVNFHIDLEQWNFTFRWPVLAPLIAKLNQVFGVHHFDWAMRFFSEAFFVNGDRFCPPGLFNQFTSWTSYPGGNQGICQKLWTLATILVITKAMGELALQFHLMGSGDNQVLAVGFPPDSHIEQSVQVVKTKLEAAFDGIGLIVKLEETWYSKYVLAYQRKYYYKGISLPLGMKTMCRFAAGTSEGQTNLIDMTSTAMGAAATLSGNLQDKFVGPLLGLTEWVYTIKSTASWDKNSQWSKEWFVLMTLVNSDMGYFPMIQMPGFLYAGHPDSTTECIAMLSALWNIRPGYRHLIAKICQIPSHLPKPPDVDVMIMNGGAPNVRTPISTNSLKRLAVRLYLKETAVIKNRKVKAALTGWADSVSNDLYDQIMKIRPFDFRIAQAIWNCSPMGQLHHLQKKFEGMSSMRRIVHAQDYRVGALAQKEVEKEEELDLGLTRRADLLSLMGSADRKFLHHVTTKYRSGPTVRNSFWETMVHFTIDEYQHWVKYSKLNLSCSFALRKYWTLMSLRILYEVGKGPNSPEEDGPIYRDVEGFFAPAPIEQCRMVSEAEEPDPSSVVYAVPTHQIPSRLADIEMTRGPNALYVGSHTRSTVPSLTKLDLLGSDTGSAVNSIYEIQAWLRSCDSSPDLIQFLIDMLVARVPSLEGPLLAAARRSAGGCMAHRMHMPGAVSGAFISSRSMVSTWYIIRPEQASKFQKGGEDFTVFFQANYQHMLGVLRFKPPTSRTIAFEIRPDCCTYPILPVKYSAADISYPPSMIYSSILSVGDGFSQAILRQVESSQRAESYKLGAYSDPLRAIAAVLAYLLVSHLRKYQRGSFNSSHISMNQGVYQALLNVTLVRKVPVEELLASVFIHLCHYKCLTWQTSPGVLIRILENLIIVKNSLLEIEFLKPLASALITAQKLPELARFLGQPPVYTQSDGGTGMLQYIMRGIIKAGEVTLSGKIKAALVIVESTLVGRRVGLHHFLRYFSPLYRKASNEQPYLEAIPFLISQKGVLDNCAIYIVSELNTLVEQARALKEPEIVKSIHYPIHSFSTEMRHAARSFRNDPWFLVDSSGKAYPGVKGSQLNNASDPENVLVTAYPRLFQILRYPSNTSGARFKIEEIIQCLGDARDPPELIVTVAEGSGSMASALLHWFPDSCLIFNTLISTETMPPEALIQYAPPELQCNHIDDSRLLNIPYSSMTQGDLTKQETWEELSRYIPEDHAGCKWLTWDMEANSGHLRGASVLLQVFLLENTFDVCIIKVFLDDLLTLWTPLVTSKRFRDYKVSLIKPLTSDLNSDEMYLVLDHKPGSRQTMSWAKLVQEAFNQLDSARYTALTAFFVKVDNFNRRIIKHPPCSWVGPLAVLAQNPGMAGYERLCDGLLTTCVDLPSDSDRFRKTLPRAVQHMIGSKTRGMRVSAAHYGISLWLMCQLWIVDLSLPKAEKLGNRAQRNAGIIKRIAPMLRALCVSFSEYVSNPEAHPFPTQRLIHQIRNTRSHETLTSSCIPMMDHFIRIMGQLLVGSPVFTSSNRVVVLQEAIRRLTDYPQTWAMSQVPGLFGWRTLERLQRDSLKITSTSESFDSLKVATDVLTRVMHSLATYQDPRVRVVVYYPEWEQPLFQNRYGPWKFTPKGRWDLYVISRLPEVGWFNNLTRPGVVVIHHLTRQDRKYPWADIRGKIIGPILDKEVVSYVVVKYWGRS